MFPQGPGEERFELEVRNLPPNKPHHVLQRKLSALADNCGGKVGVIAGGAARVRFSTYDAALR